MTNMFGPIFTIEPRTHLACDARLKMDFGTVLASHYIHGGWAIQLQHYAAYEGETLQIAVDKLKARLVKDANNLLCAIEVLNVRPEPDPCR